MRPEGREPLPDKAGESTLLSRSGGEKGLRVFHPIKINAEANAVRKDIGVPSEVKISIGNISVAIPAAETALVNSLIKELLLKC